MINSIETKTTTQIILDDKDIIILLKENGYIPKEALDITVIFNTPGGNIHIDKHNPLEVYFTTKTKQEIPYLLKPQQE